MASVATASKLSSPPRRYSYGIASASSNRRPPVPLKSYSTNPARGMDSRYYRPPSPRRYANPARSSTGTFMDPASYDAYYTKTSPRSSGERLPGTHHAPYVYAPSHASSSSRSSNGKYDSYSGRKRSNTVNDEERSRRSPIGTLRPAVTIPIRTHGSHALDTQHSPLARSWDDRGESYIQRAPRHDHKRIYSIDDNKSAKLIAEIEPHRQSDRHGTTSSSGGQRYHYSQPLVRTADLRDDDYSYTDPASMYRETEPAWRRPRAGSIERGSRPVSMTMERGPRTSTRDLGPPPSTRGFDKINSGMARSGSVRDHVRTSSLDRSGGDARYYDEPHHHHSRSSRHQPAIHQESKDRDHRRDAHPEDYDRRARDPESRRHNTADRYEDHDIASRGFGIHTGESVVRDDSLDRQPIWQAHETVPVRADGYGGGSYYPSDDPRRPPEARMPEPPRVPRDRDTAAYDDRSIHRERDRHSRDPDEHSHAPAAAAAAAGAVAAYGATEKLKSRERDRRDDRDMPREQRFEEDERKRSRRIPSPDESNDERSRHYVDREGEEPRRDSSRKDTTLDPDEEYRRRIQQEQERASRSTRDRQRDPDLSDSDREKERRRRSEGRDSHRADPDARLPPSSTLTEPARSRYEISPSGVLDKNIVQEPESLDAEAPSRSLQIVAPPRSPPDQPKGILKRPTVKFPEEPDPIREGVAPHKSALKGKDIPPDARWTKIDRRLVNPEALLEAKERFEERMDCVIVLRVLTKEEIQKLADRTKQIRDERVEEYERRERRERRRSRRDDEDRDEKGDDDTTEDEREDGRPRMIESGR